MARAKKIPLITDFNHIPAEALVPEEEQPYPLPEHWKWVRLGAVIDLLSGRDAKLADCNDSGLGIPYVMGASNIRDSRLEIERWIEKPEVVSHAGDLLLTVKGTVGKLYIQTEPELNLSRQLMGLHPSTLISVSYLERFFATHVEQLSAQAVGLIPGISRAHILDLAIPLPPIEEQKQIVAYLDEKLGKINSVREKLQDFLDHADKRKDNLIEAGVTGHLTSLWREEHLSEASQDTELPEGSLVPEEEQPYPIPETWKWVRLKYVGNFVSGSGFPKHLQGQTNKTYPFYKVGNLVNTDKCGYIADAPNSIDEQTRETIKAKVIPAESIIFAKVGEAIRLNRRAITVQPSCIDNNMMSFIPLHTCLRYSFAWFKNFDLYPLSLATSTPSVRKSALEQIPFPLPPMGEQEEIARILDEQLERIERTDKLVAEVLERLDTMKQQIVSAALAGRLSLQVP